MPGIDTNLQSLARYQQKMISFPFFKYAQKQNVKLNAETTCSTTSQEGEQREPWSSA